MPRLAIRAAGGLSLKPGMDHASAMNLVAWPIRTIRITVRWVSIAVCASPPGSTTTGTNAIGARSEVVNCQKMRRSGATPESTNATVSPGRMVV